MTRIVLADGCFDPLHAGHLAYLQAAREHGDSLVVYVSDDSFVRAKGREPLLRWGDRQEVLAWLRGVDRVVPGANTAEAIRAVRPAVLAKGADWKDRPLPPDIVAACLEVGVRVIYVDTPRQSSTALLRDWQEREAVRGQEGQTTESKPPSSLCDVCGAPATSAINSTWPTAYTHSPRCREHDPFVAHETENARLREALMATTRHLRRYHPAGEVSACDVLLSAAEALAGDRDGGE